MTNPSKSQSFLKTKPPQEVLRNTEHPRDYTCVLAETTRLIRDSRQRTLTTVNRELVCLYWQIGGIIVRQQEKARWGDGVVEQLAKDLRAAFPDMKGLSKPNLWRMRQFFRSSREMDGWLNKDTVKASSKQNRGIMPPPIVSTLSRELRSVHLPSLLVGLSWSHHTEICGTSEDPAEHWSLTAEFYS